MILQELKLIQDRCGYLPEVEVRALAERLRQPLHRLHEVASYYPHFRLQSPPAVEVLVCRDVACYLRGAAALRAEVTTATTDKAGQVTVAGVSCLGQCGGAPAVSINHQVYRGLLAQDLLPLIQAAAEGKPLSATPADRTLPSWRIDPYQSQPRYATVRRFLGQAEPPLAPEDVLLALKTADLRGMGGAGFRTHLKWSLVKQEPADIKYVICNADESEPGTFKDRELLRRAPHLMLEGLILAGLVTDAARGIIYLRHEYADEIDAVQEVLRAAEHLGVCGPNLLGSGRAFPIEVFISPGGYIQGEETALLEALEDRRGEPRNKPPYPVTHGLFGKPTVINNVETLAWVPAIVQHGGAWYRDAGMNGATGLRFVSVSGDVQRPGVYEVPFGLTVGELIDGLAGGVRDGQRLQAIAPSGPSSGFLPAVLRRDLLPGAFTERMTKEGRLPPDAPAFDIRQLPLDLNTLAALGSMLGAAFLVIGDRANMLDLARNCTEFFRNESCGKCVPCRMGTQQLTGILGENRLDVAADRQRIDEIAEALSLTSLCGLGMVAANPLTTVLKYFPNV